MTGEIYDALVADSDVTSYLSTYEGNPAVFSSTEVPEDAELPYIWTVGQVSDEPYDSKTTTGRNVLRQIGCYMEDTGSDADLEDFAEAVRTVFHRQDINVGSVIYHCTASGPIPAPTGEGVVGRIVTIRLIYQE